ncbi:MAG: pentapeptide repeat-containing protein [Leptolyngbyaceae bacterium]|nr:pentapeptide repeat-containing protein [Leptolyngbyaceae bacterium]
MPHQNYANQNLQNRSFKGQDLTGADFRGSDLRGCNFTASTLIGANFEGSRMGRSRRQIQVLMAAAILGPVVLVGLSAIAVQVSVVWFGNLSFNSFSGLISLVALVLGNFLRDAMTLNFPQVTMFLGVAALASLFAVMVLGTVGLAVVGVLSFGDAAVQGFFLLLLMIGFAFLTFRILKWLIQSIQSHPGTAFRKANLTDANFSHTVVANTDFCFASLTGICISGWLMNPYTQFTNVHCDYLYVEPAFKNRQPVQGSFQAGELEQVLAPFIIRGLGSSQLP